MTFSGTVFIFLLVSCVAVAVPWIVLPLQHTGQTQQHSKIYGEDCHHIINPLSFADNADGTVIDKVTFLMWQQAESGDLDWVNATEYCSQLQTGGFTDWRLPYIHELYGIANLSSPIFNEPFLSTCMFNGSECNAYWSSNAGRNPEYRWVVYTSGAAGDLPSGRVDGFHARCIRYTQPLSEYYAISPHFKVVEGGLAALDNTNGLVWQLQEPTVTMNWFDAISYCETLTYANSDDWRLPNIKELFSTCDAALFAPAVDSSIFQQVESKSMYLYWSSTTTPHRNDNAWMVEYKTGEVTFDSKKIPLNVRCVRSGWPSESDDTN